MKSNEDLQRDVQNALKWEPILDTAEIGVTSIDGVVTLCGVVSSYVKKIHAENAAKKVIGVKAIIENIEVKFNNSVNKTNAEIATEVLIALKSNIAVPKDKITVTVEEGWVTLEGEVTWNYEREAAINAVHYLSDIKGITNSIQLKSETKNLIEAKDVADALARNCAINENDIQVDVTGKKVTLTGTVHSWYQKDEAGRIAWNTPGIWHVDNCLKVDYEYELTR